jgi:hypothetical protein
MKVREVILWIKENFDLEYMNKSKRVRLIPKTEIGEFIHSELGFSDSHLEIGVEGFSVSKPILDFLRKFYNADETVLWPSFAKIYEDTAK